MLQNTGPMALSRLLAQMGMNGQASQEPERFDALERAGFKTERYGDIIWQIYERMGGHYMDVGASDKIARGLVRTKNPTSNEQRFIGLMNLSLDQNKIRLAPHTIHRLRPRIRRW